MEEAAAKGDNVLENEAPDYDEILEEVGEWGKWQKIIFFIMWIPSAASAMAVFMYVFIAYAPDHRCKANPGCEEGTSSSFLDFVGPEQKKNASCQIFQYDPTAALSTCDPVHVDTTVLKPCNNGYVYDTTVFPTTAAMDMDMVCGDAWKRSLAQTCYMAGMLAGSFIFGAVADLIGRRHTLILSALILSVAGSLSSSLHFVPINKAAKFSLFTLLRFVSGTGHAGTFMMAFTMVVEIVGPKSRVLCGCLIEVPFALGGLIVGLLAWAGVRSWWSLQLLCSVPWVGMVLFYYLVPESPRWLLAKGHFNELERDVMKTALINGRSFPSWLFMGKSSSVVTNEQKEYMTRKHSVHHEQHPHVHVEASQLGKATFFDLFSPPKILVRTTCMFYAWMVTTMCYYGLTTAGSELSSNIFVNYNLIILVEIPASLLCIVAMNKIGRKPVLAGSLVIAGSSCIAAGMLGDYFAKVSLSVIGKFFATACFTIIFVYTAEMFPTEIRSTAIGSCSTCARIGGMLAPQVAYLDSIWKPLPFVVMGTSAVLAGVLALFVLPETLGETLPNTMKEAFDLGSKKKNKKKKTTVKDQI